MYFDEKYENFQKNVKKYFLKTKKRKNRMYAYHKHNFSTCSDGFKSIQPTATSETGAQFVQKYICLLFWWTLDGHKPEATAVKWCPRPWILMDFQEHALLLGALDP